MVSVKKTNMLPTIHEDAVLRLTINDCPVSRPTIVDANGNRVSYIDMDKYEYVESKRKDYSGWIILVLFAVIGSLFAVSASM